MSGWTTSRSTGRRRMDHRCSSLRSGRERCACPERWPTAGTPPDRVRDARRLIDEGRTKGGRTDAHHIVVYLHAATGPDAAARMAAERERCGYNEDADVTVVGDGPAIAEAVLRWAEAGADSVVLQPTPDDPDPAGFVQFVAGDVRPLVPLG
jgi:alkanesulfonate monooxygenase SsuD/methylene tetrahydromethanopterin reductase-like flavin-dependent oxidoreductase (luciferase family)